MKSMWEKSMTALALAISSLWRCWPAARAAGLGAERDPVDHQLAAGGRGGRSAIELSEPLAACRPASRCRRRRASRSTCPASSNALGKSTVEINQGNLRSVNVAQSGERTRLVLNLKQPAGYRAQIEGKVLIVSLENSAPATLRRPLDRGQTTALRREPQPHASCR